MLVQNHNLDIVVLAESPFQGQLKISGIAEAKTTISANRATGARLEVYHSNTVQINSTDVVERAILHEIVVSASGSTVLVVSAHLDSASNLSLATRNRYAEELAADIRGKEAILGHRRTLLVGDLNFDPYDQALTGAYHLNAVPSKIVAKKGKRRVRREELPFFYNPMWAHLSDVTGGLPGTYYRATRDVDCRYWNVLDHVLIRPELLPFWDDAALNVVTNIDDVGLLNKNDIPDRKKFSDHVPIIFSVNL